MIRCVVVLIYTIFHSFPSGNQLGALPSSAVLTSVPAFKPPLAPATQAHAVSPSNHLQSYVGTPLVASGAPSLIQNQFSGLPLALQPLSAQSM